MCQWFFQTRMITINHFVSIIHYTKLIFSILILDISTHTFSNTNTFSYTMLHKWCLFFQDTCTLQGFGPENPNLWQWFFEIIIVTINIFIIIICIRLFIFLAPNYSQYMWVFFILYECFNEYWHFCFYTHLKLLFSF